MKVGVLKETTPGERRVALVPEMVARLRGGGLDVLVQSGAGDGARFGAAAFARFFPLLITAAGTARPARVLVLGTGVAGLQAIGTAKRLGAVVAAYDVRPQTKTEVESLGATFIELTSVGSAAGEGGYARALTEDERQAQQAELTGHIAPHDV